MGLPARKMSHNAEKRLEEVTLSLDGKRLIFIFESGEGYFIARHDLPGDDGTPVTAIQIFDHRGAVSITQASGEIYDLPWDSIKHYARGGHQRQVLLGQRLKKLRREHKLSQTDLAKASGLSRMQLARLEKNLSRPNLDTLLNLASTFHMTPRELLS